MAAGGELEDALAVHADERGVLGKAAFVGLDVHDFAYAHIADVLPKREGAHVVVRVDGQAQGVIIGVFEEARQNARRALVPLEHHGAGTIAKEHAGGAVGPVGDARKRSAPTTSARRMALRLWPMPLPPALATEASIMVEATSMP